MSAGHVVLLEPGGRDEQPKVLRTHCSSAPGQKLEVSFPYYTKGVVSGDETGSKHIDLKIWELLASCRSYQLIQTIVSLDDKYERGCMLVVLGFHTNITEG